MRHAPIEPIHTHRRTESTRPERRTHRLLETPLGPLLLVAADGALAAVYLPSHARRTAVGEAGDDPVLERAATQLREYFAGRRLAFDLPLRAGGTVTQSRVWHALEAIPFGATTTYGALAKALGKPNAARAVGNANARNPISIIVPCHRVVGASGALTGYAGGVPAKRWLLAHERAVVARRSVDAPRT